MDSTAQEQQLAQLLRDGFNALKQMNLDAAAECCRQALEIQPDLVQAHFLVGLVCLEGKDRKTAFSAFQSVVKLDKDHAAAWAQLSKLYATEGQMNLADEALRQLQRVGSKDPLVLDLAGTTLSLMGEHRVAQGFFETALAQQPDNPVYLQNLANNFVYFGETEKSESLFRRIIELVPNSPQAHWSLSGSRKAKDSGHIETMKKLVALPNQPPRALAFYYYALGKEYEDLERWEDAIAVFEEGARQRRQTVEYDEPAEQEMFDFLKQNYNAGWLNKAAAGNPDPSPVFVLGQPRTGTTLIERIITSHSDVHSAGELQQFGLALRRLGNYDDPRRFSKQLFNIALSMDPVKIGNLYMQTTRRMRGDTPRFVDKLPQNYLMIPLILAALPNAKIVHVRRDPVDACFASYKQLFADAYLHSYDQREMARHHLRYRDLMAHWREQFPGRFHEIHYEDCVQDLEHNARALISFLALDWQDACLNFHQQKSAVATASAVQVREPVHSRSIGRWRRYERHLKPMLEELQRNNLEPG